MSLFQQCSLHILFVQVNNPGFSIRRTLIVNTQSIQETSKPIITNIHLNNTTLPGKRPSLAVLTSVIYEFAPDVSSVSLATVS